MDTKKTSNLSPCLETMTSRERVLKTINHEPVDRVPIDLGMHYSTGISAFAYHNLREHLGLSTDHIEIPDMVQFLARVDEDVLQRFHCDCMLLHPGWTKTHQWNPRGKYNFTIPSTAQPKLGESGDWIVERNGRMRMPRNGFFFDGAWPDFDDRDEDAGIEATAKEAERIYKETEYFTVYIGFPAFFSQDPDWLCQMLLEPEKILEENKRSLDRELKRAKKIIDKMGKYTQGICINSDLGTQNAPFCRPSVYEELCAPFVKSFCNYIHDNSDLKIFIHSCGSIKPMIPILIDCGVDIFNPVQISANNMDPHQLKDEFGHKATFWGGGCNTQGVLSTGSPADVARNVRELMNIFKKGSGFVFNQVHNIMGNVPPENIVTMLDTAYEESFY